MRLRLLTLTLCLCLYPADGAQGQTAPDARGEIVRAEPSYLGRNANAPIPASLHIRNEGGSDGAGLCVISSILANGLYQGVPGVKAAKASPLWLTAKSRRGGYSPDKLARIVSETVPGEKWASYVGRDTGVLDRLSGQGYPVGATMNTGQLYNYRPIHHMISLAHYSKADGTACVVDNNRPGLFSWMPVTEFDRRWVDGGEGWAWVWTRRRAVLAAAAAFPGFALAVGLLALGIAFLAAGKARRLNLQDQGQGSPS